jgi:hypothetical protein
MLTRYLNVGIVISVAFVVIFSSFPFDQRAKPTGSEFTGANTLSYKLNNSNVIADSTMRTEVIEEEDAFYVNIWLGDGSTRITFALLDEVIKPGPYVLDDPTKKYLVFYDNHEACSYTSDEYYNGLLVIHKYDSGRNVVAGSFEFVAFSKECGTLTRVTDGHFDIKILQSI